MAQADTESTAPAPEAHPIPSDAELISRAWNMIAGLEDDVRAVRDYGHILVAGLSAGAEEGYGGLGAALNRLGRDILDRYETIEEERVKLFHMLHHAAASQASRLTTTATARSRKRPGTRWGPIMSKPRSITARSTRTARKPSPKSKPATKRKTSLSEAEQMRRAPPGSLYTNPYASVCAFRRSRPLIPIHRDHPLRSIATSVDGDKSAVRFIC